MHSLIVERLTPMSPTKAPREYPNPICSSTNQAIRGPHYVGSSGHRQIASGAVRETHERRCRQARAQVTRNFSAPIELRRAIEVDGMGADSLDENAPPCIGRGVSSASGRFSAASAGEHPSPQGLLEAT